jgi:hypothetical protein
MAYLYFYSVNPWLVYDICTKYYKGECLVYAAEEFDLKDNPPTSNPIEIYKAYKQICEDTKHDDRFKGILQTMEKVARQKLKDSEISELQRDEIIDRLQDLIEVEETDEFTPVLYVIDRKATDSEFWDKDGFGEPSKEYIIRRLERQNYEVLSYEKFSPALKNP